MAQYSRYWEEGATTVGRLHGGYAGLSRNCSSVSYPEVQMHYCRHSAVSPDQISPEAWLFCREIVSSKNSADAATEMSHLVIFVQLYSPQCLLLRDHECVYYVWMCVDVCVCVCVCARARACTRARAHTHRWFQYIYFYCNILFL